MGLNQSKCFSNEMCYDTKSNKNEIIVEYDENSNHSLKSIVIEDYNQYINILDKQYDKFTPEIIEKVAELKNLENSLRISDIKLQDNSNTYEDYIFSPNKQNGAENLSSELLKVVNENKEIKDNDDSFDISENSALISEKVLSPLKLVNNKFSIQSPSKSRSEEELNLNISEKLQILKHIITTHDIQSLIDYESRYQMKISYIRFEDGSTPLHLAVKSQENKLVEYLIHRGVDVSVKDKNGLTTLQLAYDLNNYEIMERLLEESANGYDASTINTNSIKSFHPGILYDIISDKESKDNNYVNNNPNSPISDITVSERVDEDLDKSFSLDDKVVNKRKGISRRIRKMASRVMSLVRPDIYPKSQRIQRSDFN